MRECEDLLGESGFIRLQRIHLINPRQVREYAYGSVIMTDGTRIPVEKHRDAEVRRALGAI
jgi:DNA-binding LytR/AlgR family response regulator